MKTSVFKAIESIIQVPYISDSFDTGAVCLAQDEELRTEFQTQFTTYDVVNYVYGILDRLNTKNEFSIIHSLKIPYPVDAAFFWKKSRERKKIRLERPIPELECTTVEDLKWEVFN